MAAAKSLMDYATKRPSQNKDPPTKLRGRDEAGSSGRKKKKLQYVGNYVYKEKAYSRKDSRARNPLLCWRPHKVAKYRADMSNFSVKALRDDLGALIFLVIYQWGCEGS